MSLQLAASAGCVETGWAHAQALVADSLKTWAGRSITPVVSVPAPMAPPERLLCAAPQSVGFFWSAQGEPEIVGLGRTHHFQLQGEGRFDQLLAQAQSIWPRVRCHSYPGCMILPPRLWGGLAFNVGATAAGPWQDFGDGGFTLPRWCYGVEGGQGWLSLAFRGEEVVSPGAQAQILRELETLWTLLRAPAAELPLPPIKAQSIQQLPLAQWVTQVEAIRTAIAEQGFEKIVAARRATVSCEAAIDTAMVLRRLSQGRPQFRFAFRRGCATFLGATPERLVKVAQHRVTTEALAGSIARGGEQRLMASSKDQSEHALVVREILRALTPFCTSLSYPPEPEIRSLPHVLHLCTPISGELRRSTHVINLVEALHPTPAVGGVPTASAVRWITRTEPDARGWYAGPVGWFDANGDGEFAVALRSGVVMDQRAYLYAGAGIVADSDPCKEYEETILKQQAFLSALGVVR